MPTYPIKTFFPSAARALYDIARFLVKHRTKMLAIVAIASPGDSAAVAAAIDAIITAAALFERVHSIIDPNAPPEE
jgi:hypothetical protein